MHSIPTPSIIFKSSSVFLFLASLVWRCEYLFAHHSSPSPSHPPHHCPFTPVEPGYGVELFESDYLLLPTTGLRMDPALRPCPAPSLTPTTLQLRNPIKIMCTTRLNDGIFTVHRFFRCDIRSTTPIGMCFLILGIRRNI
jgi:hypothetical protein